MDAPTELELAQYSAVSARRLQEDNLLWQVPVLSLTAQAFLISIPLASGSTAYARIAASALSLIVTVLSISLMARHRQAEIADARWMQRFEERFAATPSVGPSWRALREQQDPTTRSTRWVPYRWIAFPTWVWGLSFFGVVDLVTIAVTVAAPRIL